MSLSCAERGRMGALKANANRSPDQRKELCRTAYLAGAVKAVVSRAPELSSAQITSLRALFGPTVEVGERSWE